MSYQESDFSGLLKILGTLNKKHNNPILSMKIIEEALKNYNIIPLYPGLVGDTISKMIKKNYNNIQPGDWITFEKDEAQYGGYVKEVEGDNIIFETIFEIKEKKNFLIKKEEISNIIKVNENQLQEDWPMLIFENNNGG